MLDLTTTQQSIIDSAYKKIDWLFEVRDANGTAYHWSTKDIAASSSQIKWNSESWMPYVRWDSEEDCAYSFAIPDFSGIEMYRNKSEMGLIAPNTLTFTVLNPGTTMAPKDFNGGTVRIALKVSNGTDAEVIRRWRFVIKKTEPEYQKFRVICEDYLQNLMRGDYPNTRLIREIFDNSDIDARDNICVPIPFGTAYVPLRSVYVDDAVSVTGTDISAVASANGSRCFIRRSGSTDFSEIEWGRYITISGFTEASNNGSFLVSFATADMIQLSESAGLTTEAAGDTVTITQGTRYYVLGDTENTYTISEVRSPRAWGRKSTWALTTYDTSQWATDISWQTYVQWEGGNNFPQATESDGVDNWRMFQPIIADANNDGDADSCGVWRQGEMFLDMPTKFTRSDTASLTSPADILLFILRDMGVPEIDLARIAASKATYSAWGLEWNGALWYKENRKATLSRLLLMCHSNLVAGEAVELHPLSATSQKTITSAYIVKPAEVGEGTFRYQDIRTEQVTDCGYIAWQITGESQDRFVKALVPASGTTKTRYSKTILDLPWVQDSQDAQRLGTLFFQRSLMGEATISFIGKASLLALNPGDTVMIDGQNYGGGTVNQVIITGDAGSDPLPRKSLADGQAFFYTSDADLSSYAGTEGSDTPYQVVLHDSAGKIAWGYIGAADAAEALGSELITNGALTAWTGDNPDSWLIHITEDGDDYVTESAGKARIVASASSTQGIYQVINVTAGKLYKFTFDIVTASSGTLTAIARGNAGWGDYAYYGDHTTTGTKTVYFTAAATHTAETIMFINMTASALDMVIDNVSITEVTHVDTTGVHIVSGLNGSTRNWAEIESGFNYNDAYYTFEVSRRYPVVIDSMRINKDLSIDFSTTKYSCELDDFTDLSPSIITPINDDTTNMWMPSISGPLSDENLASDLVSNVKTYLTIGPSDKQGDYSDIQEAINSLRQKNYAGLFLKSGDYYLPGQIYLPNHDIEIFGESRDGVRLFNSPDLSAFYCGNNISITMDNFTLNSRNTQSSKYIICLAKGNNVALKNLVINAFSIDETYLSGGDFSIYAEQVHNFAASDLLINGGAYGINVDASGFSFSAERCNFNGTTTACIRGYAESCSISANRCENFKGMGIFTSSLTSKSIIANNILNTAEIIEEAIYGSGGNVAIQNNIVNIPSSKTKYSVYVIRCDESANGLCNNNSIYYVTVGVNSVCGIQLYQANNMVVTGNKIYLSNTDTTAYHYGIQISDSDRNVISNNNINLVNNDAKDIGIHLDSLSGNNQGVGNLTYNVGDALLDEGATNTVAEPKDV